jgi:hypothetical protein
MRLVEKSKEIGITYNKGSFQDILEKLYQYEELEEQGLLLRLLCKPGDTVWLANKLFSNDIKCLTIRWIEIVKGIGFHAELENGSGILFYDYEIGKSVFLTKEEAEQKLAERTSGKQC